jgi:L-idonate 5-dehydrogenase
MQTQALFCHGEKDLRLGMTALDAPTDNQIDVRVERGGICGSDLHYYAHGGFGVIRIQQPMILGHETAGIIEAVGKNVTKAKVGDRIALNPSLHCGKCSYCEAGLHHHCADMRFYGSAMRNPHIHGAFRDRIIIEQQQAEIIPAHVSPEEAALCEPLAVCLHAVTRAGSLFGKKVLITGCGPIGALTLLAARYAGASHITVLDIAEKARKTALDLGADEALDSRGDLSVYKQNKGFFDVCFEASGNNQAFLTAIELLKPQSTIVQLGLGGEFTFPVNALVAKELAWRGTFRFDSEFALAAKLVSKQVLNLKPLISDVLPLKDYQKAFDLALDKGKSMKVQLAFS